MSAALRKQKPKSYPAQNGAERLKTVVRRLPPNLPEDIFWQSVQAWVTDDTVSWKFYCPGKWRTKRPNKEGIPSRAYIAFKSEDQVATFSREYDGHLFRDKAGNESQAIVEFAPFQKVPTEKRKVDARNNTIDKDEDYLSFIEMLKNGPKTESVSLDALIAASQPPPPPTTTPLLEALKAEKLAQKDRETILRSHAHYKDIAGSSGGGPLSKKEEAKKKAAAAAVAQVSAKQPDSPAPLSKKAKKAAAAAAAVHKAPSAPPAPPQDGQGGPSSTKNQPTATTAPSSAKPAPGHPSRHRHPKAKGDAALASAVVPPSSTPTKAGSAVVPPNGGGGAAEMAPTGSPVHGAGSGAMPSSGSMRKSRPTIGLGRQLEAALSGAGVAVAPSPAGDRRKRVKSGGGGGGGGGVSGAITLNSGSSGPGAMTETGGAGKGGKQSAEHVARAAVPSILQRPEGAGGPPQPDVMIMQRPMSPWAGNSGPALAVQAEAGGGGGGGGGGHGGTPRGGGRRARGRGRGRGG